MVCSNLVLSDLSEININFNDYQRIIDDITDFIWQGDSKDNLVLKAEEFYSEYKSAIDEQMNSFASALDLYEKYKECKKNKESAEAQLANASEEDAPRLRNVVEQYQNSMNDLSSQIKSLLDTVISLKIESDVIISSSGGEFVNYYQTDYDNPYGYYYDENGNKVQGTIAYSGCGPTSMAMVLTYFLGEEIDPVEAAEWSLEHGYRVTNQGTSWAYFESIAEEYGIDCKQSGVSRDEILSSLEEGKLIVMSMGPGTFTNGGHFIVLTGIDENGKITVADPNSRERSSQSFDINIFLKEGNQQWVCG